MMYSEDLENKCESIRCSITLDGFRCLLNEYMELKKEVCEADKVYTKMDDLLREVGNSRYFSACRIDFADIRQKMLRSLNYRNSLIHEIEEITQVGNLRYFVYNVSRILGKSVEQLSLDIYDDVSVLQTLMTKGYIQTLDINKFLIYTGIDVKLITLWRYYTGLEDWK